MKKRNKGVGPSLGVPVLSFFTGGGFLDMGFEMAGFSVVWTNEVNKVFASLYEYGMTHWRRSLYSDAPEAVVFNNDNIERVFAPGIIESAFPGGRPSFFGVIGGPPCPDFSNGGRHEGGKGINGRLSKIFVNRITRINPSFFVFENVSGLYKTQMHRLFLTTLERKLERHDYCLDLKILNALELGVPQDRERLIIVGIKKNYVEDCVGREVGVWERDWFPWPEKEKYKDAKTKFAWPRIVDNGEAPVLPEGIPIELTVLSALKPDGSAKDVKNTKDVFVAYSNKFYLIKEGDTKRKSFKKLHRFRFSPTACYGNNEVHLHPWERRRLSVREAMRIQGIPDSYPLPEDATLSSKFAIVSNGVPVPLAYEVAKRLVYFFKKGRVISLG